MSKAAYRSFTYFSMDCIHLRAIISPVASMLDLSMRIKSFGAKLTAP